MEDFLRLDLKEKTNHAPGVLLTSLKTFCLISCTCYCVYPCSAMKASVKQNLPDIKGRLSCIVGEIQQEFTFSSVPKATL